MAEIKFRDCARYYQEKELPPVLPHPCWQPSSIPHPSDVIHNFVSLSFSKITCIILFLLLFFLSQKFYTIHQVSVCNFKQEGLLPVCNLSSVLLGQNSCSPVKTPLMLIFLMCLTPINHGYVLMSLKNFHKFFSN